jgi:polyvinyl alcohol dehydrogenase (cytochrome)
MTNPCPAAAPIRGLSAAANWDGWSPDHSNARFQITAAAGLTAEQIPALKLKWAFGFPAGTSVYAQTTVVDGHLFTSSDAGFVYSLSAKSGCVYWAFKAQTGVRTPIVIGPAPAGTNARFAAYFGDIHADVYAVNAETGQQLWQTRVETHALARITGGIVLERDRLIVPVSSLEELSGNIKTYSCCTFRGSVVALDVKTGSQIWKTYTIQEQNKPTKKTTDGVQLYGPAGGAVWNTPTVDAERGEIYFGTGNAYTAPAAPTTDAVMALDLNTGRILWWHQVVQNDAWVLGCGREEERRTEHCPDPELQNKTYFDVDMAASPILKKLPDGRRILITTGEAGLVNALDPTKEGTVIWTMDLAKITPREPVKPNEESQPGVGFGGAADDRVVYFPLERKEGGLTAINLTDGKKVWAIPGVKPANPHGYPPGGAQQAAATAIAGAVFSSSAEGKIRAYSTTDGHLLWEFDTARSFDTVNGVPAKGGGIGGPGVAVSGGMVYAGSGYALLSGTPGNVLLAFGVE